MPVRTFAATRLPRRPRLLAALAAMLETRRTRKALGRLDPHLRRDIGLTDHEARAEASRPFWDAPTHWKR
ncbi:DUF1127 domain-containing protein [Tabrizicola aquatica]|uniref:DUF1127 domain-containing protein n=1 Tax=Tabrizicola aquatica TaxID=909926 RepID=UPI000CD2E6F8|nr:DUF1127 domain-containing protein [Tabrizicola aquatica]